MLCHLKSAVRTVAALELAFFSVSACYTISILVILLDYPEDHLTRKFTLGVVYCVILVAEIFTACLLLMATFLDRDTQKRKNLVKWWFGVRVLAVITEFPIIYFFCGQPLWNGGFLAFRIAFVVIVSRFSAALDQPREEGGP